ncbi:MAG: hypothetical protein ACFFAS_14525 [Promethearchaeota archaeon]
MVIIHEGDPVIFDVTGLVPINSKQIDLIYLFILTQVVVLLFILLFSIMTARLLLKIHRVQKRNRYEYAILRGIESSLSFKELFSRSLVLGLLVYSMGTIVYNIADPTLLYSPYSDGYGHPLMLITIASLFLLPFATLFVLPVWLLLDSGVICSLTKLRADRQELPDIEGVHGLYYGIIMGYAGIGTIVSIIRLIYDTFSGALGAEPITTIGSPFLIVGASIIPVIAYSWRVQGLRERLVGKLEKKGVTIIDNVNMLDLNAFSTEKRKA